MQGSTLKCGAMAPKGVLALSLRQFARASMLRMPSAMLTSASRQVAGRLGCSGFRAARMISAMPAWDERQDAAAYQELHEEGHSWREPLLGSLDSQQRAAVLADSQAIRLVACACRSRASLLGRVGGGRLMAKNIFIAPGLELRPGPRLQLAPFRDACFSFRRRQPAATCALAPAQRCAGPGSGKTRVLTSRIAYMLAAAQHGGPSQAQAFPRAQPWNMLAITFTK